MQKEPGKARSENRLVLPYEMGKMKQAGQIGLLVSYPDILL